MILDYITYVFLLKCTQEICRLGYIACQQEILDLQSWLRSDARNGL